jgi:hypothetical protein
MAPFYFDDYTNVDNYCIWLGKVLCPELRPGQVVIMDNASFHKSIRIREIIENAAVNCSIDRPIHQILTRSSTTEPGLKINFPIFGAMLPIFMTDFLSLSILIMGPLPPGTL